MGFTALRSKTVSCYNCDKQYHPPLVNYMPTTHDIMGINSKSNVSDTSTLTVFSPLFRGSKHGLSYQG